MITKTLSEFFDNEAAGGILLLITAVLAFIFSNSTLNPAYHYLIQYEVFGWTLQHWVNDGLMTIFFYVVGLEIKKEFFHGALSDSKKASLAIFGALGGMIVPAIIYFVLNAHDDIDKTGWAIPMATDIAFAVGVLTLLGKRIPAELKVFLLALAIVDDLGAILVIALFYTKTLSMNFLLLSLVPFAAIFLANRYFPLPRALYIILGLAAWYFIVQSGIHPTISGVILAFLTPFTLEKNELRSTTPLNHWLHTLHPVVTFSIMPLFAFFNAGVNVGAFSLSDIATNTVSMGSALGLLIGKPLGIVAFCFTACALKAAALPTSVNWKQMMGVGFIAGIGFTMSLFINELTFGGSTTSDYAKIGILSGSILSAVIGYCLLRCKTQAAAA